jgi:hypothetical protein
MTIVDQGSSKNYFIQVVNAISDIEVLKKYMPSVFRRCPRRYPVNGGSTARRGIPFFLLLPPLLLLFGLLP